jgi:hypothetical protein
VELRPNRNSVLSVPTDVSTDRASLIMMTMKGVFCVMNNESINVCVNGPCCSIW